MKKTLVLLASLASGIALVLAMDLPRFAFEQVDAGGHSLRMYVCGTGNPTVVFETGGAPSSGGPLEVWEDVQPAVSQFTRTVSYDRAGCGLSEPGPKPRDARQVARELHTALQNADVPPPYLLVGHSFGGPLIRVFAAMYPEDVCGMVLIDPTQEEAIWWDRVHDTNYVQRFDAEGKDVEASLNEAHESRVPENMPVMLITAMGPRPFPNIMTEKDRRYFDELRKIWLQSHTDWVEKLPKGRHIITMDSSHGVPYEQPELIVQTIREMVAQRAQKP
jgi:pimeloyl-ACP methyl ester carboxylesterase